MVRYTGIPVELLHEMSEIEINNLISEIDRDQLVLILESMGINGQVRAEDLDVAQWVALSEALLKTKL